MPPNTSINVTSAAENSLGRPNFAALIGLDTPDRRENTARVLAKIEEEKLEVVRVAVVDTHGIVRARPIEAHLFSQAVRNGVAFTTALFAMDSANSIFQNVFAGDGGFGRETMGGAGDMLAMLDLSTFRVLHATGPIYLYKRADAIMAHLILGNILCQSGIYACRAHSPNYR
ncbi:MAG: hypothetical protein JOY83_21500 [Alphaproteobacteria bacterium]|nr:hypothetical protein [Alphaproteobacteria bacterium]